MTIPPPWIETPENRPAWLALRRVGECVSSGRKWREFNPLFLHGPAGTGKSHLIHSLITEGTRQRPDAGVNVLASGDVALLFRGHEENARLATAREAARKADLLVIEDLQHLDVPVIEALVQVFDERKGRQLQMVFTALEGPGRLRQLPSRLTSRLASGLVIGLPLLSPTSRRMFLEERAQQRSLRVRPDVLDWLARNVAGSVRQLEGSLTRLETLTRLHGQPLDREAVAAAFREDADAHRLTVEKIAQRVGRHFQLDPRLLRARDRARHILLPRQVGMYLARKLTRLSLQQIGAFFGGRDHSTVLHACRKVERALECDPSLSGVVRQLHADLT